MSDAAPRPVGVGVIGLGFMGSTHVRAVRAAQEAGLPCRLVAVADRDPARLSGRGTEGNLATGAGSDLFDSAIIRAHPDAASLLADPGVEAVSICTHTSITSISPLRHCGKHVLVESGLAPARRAGLLADEAARHPTWSACPRWSCLARMPGSARPSSRGSTARFGLVLAAWLDPDMVRVLQRP